MTHSCPTPSPTLYQYSNHKIIPNEENLKNCEIDKEDLFQLDCTQFYDYNPTLQTYEKHTM